MSGRLIRQRLLATTTVAGAVLLAMPAFAQTTQEAPTAPAADNPAPATPPAVSSDGAQVANTTGGGDIVVTGSRIPHPDLESASPVTIVGAQEVAVSGVTRTEDLLNALPQVFAGQGGNIANGATGTATVNLRGLGSVRTLVLVNGRRLVPGDPRVPAQDINIIPAALIKRVDVLTGGASSVYGADAVSGVVNFVLDTEFDGFKVDGQYSFYNHDNRHNANVRDALNNRGFGYPNGLTTDGGAVDVSAVFGAGFDDGRGHVTAYGNYRKIDPVTQDLRDYSALARSPPMPAATAASLGRGYNCGGSGTSLEGSFYTPLGGYYNVQGNQFAPGQVLFNFAPYNYFQRPDERYRRGILRALRRCRRVQALCRVHVHGRSVGLADRAVGRLLQHRHDQLRQPAPFGTAARRGLPARQLRRSVDQPRWNLFGDADELHRRPWQHLQPRQSVHRTS